MNRVRNVCWVNQTVVPATRGEPVLHQAGAEAPGAGWGERRRRRRSRVRTIREVCFSRAGLTRLHLCIDLGGPMLTIEAILNVPVFLLILFRSHLSYNSKEKYLKIPSESISLKKLFMSPFSFCPDHLRAFQYKDN